LGNTCFTTPLPKANLTKFELIYDTWFWELNKFVEDQNAKYEQQWKFAKITCLNNLSRSTSMPPHHPGDISRTVRAFQRSLKTATFGQKIADLTIHCKLQTCRTNENVHLTRLKLFPPEVTAIDDTALKQTQTYKYIQINNQPINQPNQIKSNPSKSNQIKPESTQKKSNQTNNQQPKINQSINHSLNQSIHQSVNSIYQSNSQPGRQSMNQSATSKQIKPRSDQFKPDQIQSNFTDHPIMSQANHSINQSITQPIKTKIRPYKIKSNNESTTNQSINPSISQFNLSIRQSARQPINQKQSINEPLSRIKANQTQIISNQTQSNPIKPNQPINNQPSKTFNQSNNQATNIEMRPKSNIKPNKTKSNP
jgi:hypothetical protein